MICENVSTTSYNWNPVGILIQRNLVSYKDPISFIFSLDDAKGNHLSQFNQRTRISSPKGSIFNFRSLFYFFDRFDSPCCRIQKSSLMTGNRSAVIALKTAFSCVKGGSKNKSKEEEEENGWRENGYVRV